MVTDFSYLVFHFFVLLLLDTQQTMSTLINWYQHGKKNFKLFLELVFQKMNVQIA